MKIELEGISHRVPVTKDFIKVDPEKCTGCSRCLIICVVNLWKMKDGIAYIVDNYKEKCLECASCYQVCSSGAIEFEYPEGGTGVVYLQG